MSPLVRNLVPVAANLSTKADINKKYEECVNALNKLQSNAQTLERTRQTRDKLAPLHVPNMIKWASRVGISLDDIDKLKIIHVSGTKGKGSTCAYCESILRHHGFRTGFFSSPHLVEVRERFKINGESMSREKFVSYFWEVYNRLEETKTEGNGSMPAYFAFLTIMALHVFMKEQTDVAILEVGIGGQYDSTNLVRKPVVCGVTSLGLDHVTVLGNTIDKIAWQKGGIFKPGTPAFTSPQPPEAMEVLQQRAQDIGCSLKITPPFTSYQRTGEKFKLGIAGHMQKVNASLALQLTREWMRSQGMDREVNGYHDTNGHVDIKVAESFPLNPSLIDGLMRCKWLGRNQTIKKDRLTYYLDGAHTVESIQQCVDWFQKHSKSEAESIRGKVVKILLYNSTGDRDNTQLLSPLLHCGFDGAVFCPNISYTSSSSADMTNMSVTKEMQAQKCQQNMDVWQRLSQSKHNQSEVNGIRSHEMNGDSLSSNQLSIHNEEESCNHASSSKIPRLAEDFNQSNIQQSQIETMTSGAILNQSKHCTPGHSNSDLHTPNVCDNLMFKFSCIYDALLWASHGRDPYLKDSCDLPNQFTNANHIQVLVTGSIHLVGGVLSIIDDDYN